jgi:hypothetical protein
MAWDIRQFKCGWEFQKWGKWHRVDLIANRTLSLKIWWECTCVWQKEKGKKRKNIKHSLIMSVNLDSILTRTMTWIIPNTHSFVILCPYLLHLPRLLWETCFKAVLNIENNQPLIIQYILSNNYTDKIC